MVADRTMTTMAPDPEERVTAAVRENAPDTASKVSAESDGSDTNGRT